MRQNFSGAIDYEFYPTGAFGVSQAYEVDNYVIVKKGATISGSYNNNAELYVYGTWDSYNGCQPNQPSFSLPKLQKTTALFNQLNLAWSSSVSGINMTDTVAGVYQQNDGKVIVIGNLTGSTSRGILRLTESGSIDTSYNNTGAGFSPGLYSAVNWPFQTNLTRVTFDSSNNYVYYIPNSNTQQYNGNTISTRIGKIDENGAYAAFGSGSGFNVTGSSIYAQNDSKVLVFFNGSGSTNYNGVPFSGSIRLNSDGTIDNTWSLTGSYFTTVSKIEQYDNKIYQLVGSTFKRYNMSGSVDVTWTEPSASITNAFGFGISQFSIG
jgi:hypothetical protein